MIFCLFSLAGSHGCTLGKRSIPDGSRRSARTGSCVGLRSTAFAGSVTAPNRYCGSALARWLRLAAAKTVTGRKSYKTLLGLARHAQETHPYPRLRRFKGTAHATSHVSSYRSARSRGNHTSVRYLHSSLLLVSESRDAITCPIKVPSSGIATSCRGPRGSRGSRPRARGTPA